MKKPLLVCALCMLCASAFALPELPPAPASSSQESITDNTAPAAASSNGFGINFGVNLLNNLSMPDGFSREYSTGYTFGLHYLFLGDDTTVIRSGFGLFYCLGGSPVEGENLLWGSDSMFLARTVYATAQIYPFRRLGGNLYIKGNLGAKLPTLFGFLLLRGLLDSDEEEDWWYKSPQKDSVYSRDPPEFELKTAFYCAFGVGLDIKNKYFLEVMYNYYSFRAGTAHTVSVKYDFLAVNIGVRFSISSLFNVLFSSDNDKPRGWSGRGSMHPPVMHSPLP